MKTRTELAAYIRYQLAQLGAKNKAMEFEHICFEFARLRICTNLLQATGPVQAGGDQGRDFETFRSYIAKTPFAESSFVGRAADSNLVFACSLNQQVASKIKGDLREIFRTGAKPETVYFFSEPDYLVAKRHKSQEFCRSEYGAELEIIDGQTIADQLASPDAFWIAEQYLSVPADFFPQVEDLDEEYLPLKQRWITEKDVPQTYADFLEIKRGLREATFNEDVRPDLNGWLEVMRPFTVGNFGTRLTRKAEYEIAVAQLRGKGDLSPEADTVQSYFDGLQWDMQPSEYRDAYALLMYCCAATEQSAFNVDYPVIDEWREALNGFLDRKIAESKSATDKCSLYETKGYMKLIPCREGAFRRPLIDEAFSWWNKALDGAKDAPMYEIEPFVDLLLLITPIIGEHPKYDPFVERVDLLVAERAGADRAAHLAKERALTFYDNGMKLKAMDQLQKAKINWFSGETISECLLSMLFIGQCYNEMGLSYAARYYMAGAAYTAVNYDDDSIRHWIARAMSCLCDTHYYAGEGLSFLYAFRDAYKFHYSFAPDPHNLERHEHLTRLMVHACVFRALVRRTAPALLESVDAVLAQLPMPPSEIEQMKQLSEGEPWASTSLNECIAKMDEEIGRHFFHDIGPERIVRWNALGIEWNVEFASSHETNCIAEEFVATLQILQAELADTDLLIVPATAKIQLEFSDMADENVEQLPDNGQLAWKVRLPTVMSQRQKEGWAPFSISVAIIASSSAMSQREIMGIVSDRLSKGLAQRTFTVQPARVLFQFVGAREDEKLQDFSAAEAPELNHTFSPHSFPELEWFSGPGPGYSKERAQEYLENRYRKAVKPIRFTLPRLMADDRCRGIIEGLKKSGMLDWQILLVITNVAMTHAMDAQRDSIPNLQAAQRFTEQFVETEENEDSPNLPLEFFTQEAVEMVGKALISSAFKVWDLSINRPTPDFEGMKKLLDVRYGHSTDDIEHEDFFQFGQSDSEG